jgi:hypothetical protein
MADHRPPRQLRDRRGRGRPPTNSYWLQGYSPGVVGRPIEQPPALGRLLADAERDLGPP